MPTSEQILRPPPQAPLAFAMELHRMGFSLLPLKGKIPHARLLPDGKWGQFRLRRASVPEVEQWFVDDPECNFGVICGQVFDSRGEWYLTVVDLDGPAPRGVHLPSTPSVRTQRGWHFYYRSDDPIPTRTLPWGDIKGENSYVVAPPSVHPDGSIYEWADLPRMGSDPFAEVPDWVREVQTTTLPKNPPQQGLSSWVYPQLTNPVGTLLEAPDKGEWLSSWDTRDDFVSSVCRVVGIPDHVYGRAFRCCLPDHTENHPSASLHPDRLGRYVYRDWHSEHHRLEWLTLAEVYASKAYGSPVKLTGPEMVVWKTRLLSETGFLKLPELEDPLNLSLERPALNRIYDGFRLLVQCKLAYGTETATAFAWRFAAAWCGLSVPRAGEAIRELVAKQVLRRTGQYRGMYLYDLNP